MSDFLSLINESKKELSKLKQIQDLEKFLDYQEYFGDEDKIHGPNLEVNLEDLHKKKSIRDGQHKHGRPKT